MADGFSKPESQVSETMTCVMNATEIPRETDLLFEVKALNCFGAASEPIDSGTVRFKGVVVKWRRKDEYARLASIALAPAAHIVVY